MAPDLSSSRRDLLRVGGLAALAGLAGCSARGDPPEPWTPGPGTWPHGGYDTQNTRHNPHATPPSEPSIRWEVEDSTARFETLAVADAVFVGGTSVRAYEPDGTLRWKLNRSAEAMAVHGGTCYVADVDDGVAALSPSDGSVVWETEVSQRVYGILPTTDRVFVAVHDRLVCLDAATGERRWAQWGDGAGPTGFALDDALYTAEVGTVARRSPRNVVQRFRDQPPGAEWEATRELSFPSAPTVADGLVVVPDQSLGSTEGGIAAFATDEGSFRWNVDLGDRAYSPALVGDLVVAGGTSPDGETSTLVAVDRTDGTVRWRTDPGHWATSVTLADDVALVAGGATDYGITGGISAYGLDGERHWSVDATGRVSALAPVGDRVYATTTRGHVYALG